MTEKKRQEMLDLMKQYLEETEESLEEAEKAGMKKYSAFLEDQAEAFRNVIEFFEEV